jgi:hypothetical protein
VCRMEPIPTRERGSRRLANNHSQIRFWEIVQRLKAQYDADTHAPISRRLMGLLDAIDRPQRGGVEPGSK